VLSDPESRAYLVESAQVCGAAISPPRKRCRQPWTPASAAGTDADTHWPRGRPGAGHGPSANGPVTTVPLESKWVEQGWKGKARTIDAKFGRGILATKCVLDTTGNIWAVPAPLLALLLQ
jgi:hypothetical protein